MNPKSLNRRERREQKTDEEMRHQRAGSETGAPIAGFRGSMRESFREILSPLEWGEGIHALRFSDMFALIQHGDIRIKNSIMCPCMDSVAASGDGRAPGILCCGLNGQAP